MGVRVGDLIRGGRHGVLVEHGLLRGVVVGDGATRRIAAEVGVTIGQIRRSGLSEVIERIPPIVGHGVRLVQADIAAGLGGALGVAAGNDARANSELVEVVLNVRLRNDDAGLGVGRVPAGAVVVRRERGEPGVVNGAGSGGVRCGRKTKSQGEDKAKRG